MAAQLVASVGSVEVFRFSPFCFLGKQVTSRNTNHFIFMYENHNICIYAYVYLFFEDIMLVIIYSKSQCIPTQGGGNVQFYGCFIL